jgi:hypothetical protein
MVVLPIWYEEEEEKLRQAVWDIARRQNIKFAIVTDSKTIEDCIDAIMIKMYNISQSAKPEFTESQIRDFRRMEEAEKANLEKKKQRRSRKKR